MNGFLKPLVDELCDFWIGKELNVCGSESAKVVRCALLCASCDLPAGRKLCGFLSYNAHQGCSRCTKSFALGYSGFDRENWSKRSRSEHLTTVSRTKLCKTKRAMYEIECSKGYRYAELLRLPYFAPSRMLAIDPMHNLFLGSAKHVLKDIWIDRGIITEAQFVVIQNRVDDVGRIPNKIRSGFASFTADQFKNWIVYFSILALHDILVGDHLECWRHFILACRYLCKSSVTSDELKLADALLMHFCKRCERLYTNGMITPNMHMHSHLRGVSTRLWSCSCFLVVCIRMI